MQGFSSRHGEVPLNQGLKWIELGLAREFEMESASLIIHDCPLFPDLIYQRLLGHDFNFAQDGRGPGTNNKNVEAFLQFWPSLPVVCLPWTVAVVLECASH